MVQPNIVLRPVHTVGVPVMDAANGFTLTVTFAVAVQPLALVPESVYVVVTDGAADVVAQVAHERPVDGAHE